ncbi:MAG: threonine/serine dehydratase [Nannocystaceae bacterium]
MKLGDDATEGQGGGAAAPLSIDDVRAAAARLGDRVRRTPALRCAALDELADAELWLKAENLQHVGAFKARGALNALSRLDPALRARGVITYSSGNHAQAVAYAARSFAIPATIAMPVDAPKVKVAGVRALGAEIMFAGTTSDDRREAARELAARTGAAIIEPFDHADTICGQGTATLELCAQVAEATGGGLDALVIPVGGGGLLAGACLVCEEEGIPVFTAEPARCDAFARSLEAGERVDVQPGPTIADGLKPVRIGALNWEIAARTVRGAFRVEDDELGLAMVRLLLAAKILVEPSGAAALAVALRRALPIQEGGAAEVGAEAALSPEPAPARGRRPRIGVLLSGGNVAPELVAELLSRYGGQV